MKTFPTISYIAQQINEALDSMKLRAERIDYIERCLRAVYQRGFRGEVIDGEITSEDTGQQPK